MKFAQLPRLFGGFIGMVAAFGIGHWIEETYQLGPWVTGGTVCDPHGQLLACTGYPPAGVILIAFPLVVIGMTTASRITQTFQ